MDITKAPKASPVDFSEKSPWRRLNDFLFGYDYFISYAWADGRAYAVKLAQELEKRRLECFLDSDDYAKGDNWKLVGQRALRKTSRLVLVGSARATTSKPVLRELEIFTGRGRHIIPIDFEGSLDRAKPTPAHEYIAPEVLYISEQLENLATGPSDRVVNELASSFKLLTQDQKRTRIFAALAMVFAAIAILAVVFWLNSQKQTRIATDRYVRLIVDNGRRLLNEEDFPGALLWFANALATDSSGDPVHRMRVAAVQNHYPQLQRLFTHDSRIRSIEFSPDGRTLLVCGGTTTRVWDLDSGMEACPSLAHPEEVTSATFSPDGRIVATLSSSNEADEEALDREVASSANPEIMTKDFLRFMLGQSGSYHSATRLWDAKTGKELANFTTVTGEPLRVQYHPDGRHVLAVGRHAAVVWETSAAGKEPKARMQRHLTLAALSPDGRRVVTAAGGGWEVLDLEGNPVAEGQHPDGSMNSISHAAFGPDGSQVATCDRSGKVMINPIGGNRTKTVTLEHPAEVQHVEFSPDGKWIATGTGFLDGYGAWLWDVGTGKEVYAKSLQTFAHPDPVCQVSFSPDGRYLLTVSRRNMLQGEARIWDCTTGTPVTSWFHGVQFARWSPNGRHVATADSEGAVKLWDVFTGEPIPTRQQREALQLGTFTTDGKRAVVDSRDGLYVWDAMAGAVVSRGFELSYWSEQLKENVREGVERSVLSRDGSRLLATGGNASSVWDVTTGARLGLQNKYPVHYKSAVTLSPTGQTALIAGGNGSENGASGKLGRVVVWRCEGGALLFEPLLHEDHVTGASFSVDGRQILSASKDGKARLWDAESGRLVQRFEHPGAVNHAVFDPAGRLVVTACVDNTTRFWDSKTGQQSQPSIRHEGEALQVIFGPDKKSLLTLARAADAGTCVLRIWDARTRRPKSPEMTCAEPSGSAYPGFSPCGRLVVSREGGGFRVWDARTGEPVTPRLVERRSAMRKDPMTLFTAARGSLYSVADVEGRGILMAVADNGKLGVWKLPSETRKTDNAVMWTEVMASRAIGIMGSVARLSAPELVERWNSLKRSGAIPLAASTSRILEWHRKEAEECEATHEWHGAGWHLSRIAENSPSDTAVLLRRGRANAELDRWRVALDDFSRAIELGVRTPEILCAEARLRIASDDVPGAQRACKELLERFGKQEDAELWNAVARIASLSPETAALAVEAVALAQKGVNAAKADADRYPRMGTLGAALYRAGRFEEASQSFEQIGKANYSFTWDQLYLSMTLWRLGKEDEARKVFEKATGQKETFAGGVDWQGPLELSVLRREADRLMREPNVAEQPAQPSPSHER